MIEERVRKQCRNQYNEGEGYMSPYATGTQERLYWDREVNEIFHEIYNERRDICDE